MIYEEVISDDFELPFPLAQTCSQIRNESLPFFLANVSLIVEFYFDSEVPIFDLFLESTSAVYDLCRNQEIDTIPSLAWLKLIHQADISVCDEYGYFWAKLSVLFSNPSHVLAEPDGPYDETVNADMYCRAMRSSIEAELAIFAAHRPDLVLSGSLLKRILSHVQHFQRAFHDESYVEGDAGHA